MQTQVKKSSWHWLPKVTILLVAAVACFYAGHAFAAEAPAGSIGEMATRVTQSFEGIGKLMIAISYLAGIGFVLAAIFKFKQHKDNPTQIPLGTPLAMLVIGIVLVFLPAIFGPAGKSIFGDAAKPGGFQGQGTSGLPGQTGGTP